MAITNICINFVAYKSHSTKKKQFPYLNRAGFKYTNISRCQCCYVHCTMGDYFL
nr:MAG TPA: hypothetical protein [Caudoviricetes sp.]